MLIKAEYITSLSAAPTIDTLVVIAHYTDIAMSFSKGLEEP